MGAGGISLWQLLIILLIVVMLFGTKKLRGMGSDLGSAVKGFKKAINTEEDAKDQDTKDQNVKAVDVDFPDKQDSGAFHAHEKDHEKAAHEKAAHEKDR